MSCQSLSCLLILHVLSYMSLDTHTCKKKNKITPLVHVKCNIFNTHTPLAQHALISTCTRGKLRSCLSHATEFSHRNYESTVQAIQQQQHRTQTCEGAQQIHTTHTTTTNVVLMCNNKILTFPARLPQNNVVLFSSKSKKKKYLQRKNVGAS